MALVASDRLIIPCTADGASVRALKNVFKIVYGIGAEDDYIAMFSKDMKDNNLTLPTISLIVQKEIVIIAIDQVRHLMASKRILIKCELEYLKNYPNIFTNNSTVQVVKDCNALLPIVSYGGEILSDLIQGKQYSVYKKKSTASGSQLKGILQDIKNLISNL